MQYRMGSYIQSAVCFCLLLTAITAFMFSNLNYSRVSQKIIDFEQENIDSVYLRISDVYGNENQKSLSEFFSENDSLKRMKEFNKTLRNEYNFLEFDNQPLLIKEDLNYKDECREDYGTDSFGINDDIGVSLKSVQIGETSYNAWSLDEYIETGKGFTSESFLYDGSESIEAVLGYEYSNSVSIGDVIKVNYLSKDISVKVNGFFKKDTYITINNNIFFMDQYIAIPFVDLESSFEASNEDEQRFQNILYSLKNWGYIKVNNGDDFYEYKDRVDQISKDLNLKYVLNDGFVSSYIKNISNTINSSKGIFFLVSLILFLFSSAIVLYIYIWDYNKNKKNYAIHLVCGCSLLKLKIKIYTKIFIQFILSLFMGALINKFILGDLSLYTYDGFMFNQSVFQTTLLSFIIMIVIFAVINLCINRSNIYNSLRKEE